LKLGGLSLGDADLEIMGFADGIPAMTSHRLDATELIEPLVTLAEQKGIARVLVPAGAVDPAAELAVVYFSPEFAKDADLATRYLAAFLQGERDYADAFIDNKDRDAAIAILVQDLSVKDPKLWATARPQHVDLNGEINVASLKTQAAFYKAEGAISGAIPDIDKYVDPQFAAAAVKLIGRR
jgi:NitT/TauT family transport system substrate-binding protein